MRPRGPCLLLIVSACSSPDPPQLDPLTSGNVRVTVLAPVGVPEAGATVVFVGADGNPVAAGVTGADGTARHDLLAGGSVTVVEPDLGSLFTFLDLQPGDELQVGLGAEPIVGSVHVVPPGAYPGAAGYTLELGCLPAQAIDPAPTRATI